MTTHYSNAWFRDIVNSIRKELGEDTAKDLLIYWNANETEIALEGLVETLVYKRIMLPLEMQKLLIDFAEDFDARTKGRTRYAKELHALYG